MTEISETRLATLPKWARHEIERLRLNVGYYQRKLGAGPEDSDTFADPYGDSVRPLGAQPTIEFKVGNGRIRARIEKFPGELFPHVVIDCDDILTIEPRASNSVNVRVRTR